MSGYFIIWLFRPTPEPAKMRLVAEPIMSNKLMQPVQYSPDVPSGLGPILHALDRLNDPIHLSENQVVRDLLTDRPYGNPSLCALFLRDNVSDLHGQTYSSDRSETPDQRIELTSQTKKRFITIMLRVSRSHEGISRGEREFIRQFWRALQQRQSEQLQTGNSQP